MVNDVSSIRACRPRIFFINYHIKLAAIFKVDVLGIYMDSSGCNVFTSYVKRKRSSMTWASNIWLTLKFLQLFTLPYIKKIKPECRNYVMRDKRIILKTSKTGNKLSS